MSFIQGFLLHQLGLLVRERYRPVLSANYVFKDFAHSSHRRILEMLRRGEVVLDLGCGDGMLALRIQEIGCRVARVDRLPASPVQEGLDRYVSWDLADENDLPFPREFDCVVLGDKVEHVFDGVGLFLRVRKVLKQNGRLIVSTPNIALWYNRLKLLMGRFE
ncbi:class I SAM-dependent methyltransferase [candidate division KSB1 bacterium]|nr:class I SAM-dependent methyltransferase [candidate division KSB1 bacterium]